MKDDPSLNELIRQIGNGDPLAIEALFDRMRRPLTRYIKNRYAPPLTREDIEDVVQYTFIQIFRYACSYKGKFDEASAKKWIFSIARHQSLKLIRVANSTQLYLDLDNGSSKEEESGGGPPGYRLESPENTADQALEAIFLQEVRAYIKTLSDRERAILEMRVEQISYEEIGKNMRLSKPRIHQIMAGIARNARRHFGLDE